MDGSNNASQILEFAYFYNALGVEITIIEMLPQVLPIEDKEISDVVAREFKKSKIRILTGTKTEDVIIKNDKVFTKVSGSVNETIDGENKTWFMNLECEWIDPRYSYAAWWGRN